MEPSLPLLSDSVQFNKYLYSNAFSSQISYSPCPTWNVFPSWFTYIITKISGWNACGKLILLFMGNEQFLYNNVLKALYEVSWLKFSLLPCYNKLYIQFHFRWYFEWNAMWSVVLMVPIETLRTVYYLGVFLSVKKILWWVLFWKYRNFEIHIIMKSLHPTTNSFGLWHQLTSK